MPRIIWLLLPQLLCGSGCRSEPAQAPEPHDVVTSASAASPQDGPDPCALLEDSEITPLSGVVTNAGQRGGTVCRWKAASGPGRVTLQLEPDNGQAIYDFARNRVGNPQELPGIGDQAFVSEHIVGVRVGDRFLSLVITPNASEETQQPADAVALAKIAVARLREPARRESIWKRRFGCSWRRAR